MRSVFRRPSPAMVVAVIALIAALGGSAIAGGVLTKKKVNKIITKRAPGLTVGNSKKLDGSGPGEFVKVSRWAYGEIDSPGTVKSTPTPRGIVSVSRQSTGVYCFRLAFTPTFGFAEGTGDSSTTFDALVDIPPTGGDCPGANATVYLDNSSTFARVNDDFNVVFGGF